MKLLTRVAVRILCVMAFLMAWPGVVLAGEAASDNKPVTIPFESVNNNIFLQVSVNSRSLWFLLDTGDKYAVIDLTAAKSLGLQLGDPVPVGGAGTNIIMGNLLRNSPFTIPGLKDFSQPLFIAVPLDDLARRMGHEFAGTLGFDFISQFVVEIDYVKRTLTLHDRARFRYEGHGDILPITFNAAGHPQVQAQILDAGRPPIDGTFVFDLGSGAAVILNSPFVNREKFLQSGRPVVPWLGGRGFGGAIPGSVGRVKGLKLGSSVIDDPVIVFSQAQGGPLGSADAQGNIGAAILEKFNILLDYGNKRIILEPNANFGEPLEYSRSGLLLVAVDANNKSFRVEAVLDHAPASESGLRPGDLLIGVNGHAAGQFTLSEIRAMFKSATECELTVQRDDRRLTVKLKLRRLI
ncbi:MAG TPA: aspartyl protease family protein [Bryobacteraceae bacterium]|nr:aspartyl protease family protein [Bryobacteraceae bacterium]